MTCYCMGPPGDCPCARRLREPPGGWWPQIMPLPPMSPVVPHGCICPPGAEKTCQGWNCPRRGFAQSGLSSQGIAQTDIPKESP